MLIDLASQKKVAIATWRADKEAKNAEKLQAAAFESESARKVQYSCSSDLSSTGPNQKPELL